MALDVTPSLAGGVEIVARVMGTLHYKRLIVLSEPFLERRKRCVVGGDGRCPPRQLPKWRRKVAVNNDGR
jgi:hypothetical protein